MKKAFVISWYFPPVNSSEGLVTFKLLKNSQYEYDVYTQKNNLSWTYGNKEEKLISKNITPIFSEGNNIDEWVREGIKYFSENHDKYEYIMSRSMAPESHIIANEIKKKFPNVKWIASFGDPIYDNPFLAFYEESSPYSIKGFENGNFRLKYVLSPKRILKNMLWNWRHSRYLKTTHPEVKNKKIQMETMMNCDLIILNNDYQKRHMLKTCEKNIESKIVILPHSFDLDFYLHEKKKRRSNKKTFVYLGHLDEIRNPRSFLEALVMIKKNHPELIEKINIEFYGNLSDKDKVYIMDNNMYDFVKVNKAIDYFGSLQKMQEADWLLSFDANLGKYVSQNIFFPAKISDYLGAGTKIFAVTMLEGASADILRETGAVVSSHSVDDVYVHLLSILSDKLDIEISNVEQYDARNVAKKYDEIIRTRIVK